MHTFGIKSNVIIIHNLMWAHACPQGSPGPGTRPPGGHACAHIRLGIMIRLNLIAT